MSQPCINCGSEEVKTTTGKREVLFPYGEVFHVQRVCKGCGFSLRVRWGDGPDTWEPSRLGRHTTYMYASEPFRERRIGIVACGVLLVGDEQEIGSSL